MSDRVASATSSDAPWWAVTLSGLRRGSKVTTFVQFRALSEGEARLKAIDMAVKERISIESLDVRPSPDCAASVAEHIARMTGKEFPALPAPAATGPPWTEEKKDPPPREWGAELTPIGVFVKPTLYVQRKEVNSDDATS